MKRYIKSKLIELPRPEEIQQGGVLGELWGCVARMRKYNNSLNESKKSLVKFIG